MSIENNIIDSTEFDISRWLNKSAIANDITEKVVTPESEEASKWETEANAYMITPEMNLCDLEAKWILFNSMPKKKRRESDWKSLEIFGCTNKDHYDKLRIEFLKHDLSGNLEDEMEKINISESYIDDSSDDYYKSDPINYTTADVEKAREWAKDSDKVIIVPTRNLNELEELWNSYNMMIKKHRRESDWISMEIFGVSNLHHYEYIKNQFLKEDLKDDDKEYYGSIIESVSLDKTKKYFSEALKESIPDTVKSLTEMMVQNNGPYDDMIISNIVSDVMDKYDSDIVNPSDIVDDIICRDIPYIDPEEMIDMGVFGQSPTENFYGVLADNSMLSDTISVKEWFELYRSANKALYTEFNTYASVWLSKVRELIHEFELYKNSWDEQKVLARKQSILELGWDPDVEFSTKARIIAREMAIHRMKSNFSGNNFKIVDLREFRSNSTSVLSESSSTSLKPVYIVMIEGKSYFSRAIKTITKDIYSHVAISLDPQLHDMYSYGIATNKHSDRSGFRKEDINDLPIGSRIGVFAFFVSDKVYKKITEFINNFKDNVEKTSYSFTNLITYLFNIPYNTEWKLVCSQFVDRCLQTAGINITKADPSKVSPSDLNKALLNENRIYNLYEGLHANYDYKKINKLVVSLSKTAKPLKEAYSDYYISEEKYIIGLLCNINNIDALLEMKNHINIIKTNQVRNLLENVIFDAITLRPLGEAKEFPIQFDKDGNLLLKNIKKIDYEAEYAKSHKLLKQYEKTDNFEGMKYELSKLWMMMCMISDTLYSKKFKDLPSMAIASSSAHKAKAKINNDFQYYLKKVIKAEPNFNFTEYYDASPFSSAVTKINNSTLTFMGKIIMKMIKSF